MIKTNTKLFSAVFIFFCDAGTSQTGEFIAQNSDTAETITNSNNRFSFQSIPDTIYDTNQATRYFTSQ